MIQVVVLPALGREWTKIPAPIREWAQGYIDAAEAPDATEADVIDGASRLKGGLFRGSYVRKWRHKFPHGEYRLVFRVENDKVTFVSLDPRGDDYKTAARRLRAL